MSIESAIESLAAAVQALADATRGAAPVETHKAGKAVRLKVVKPEAAPEAAPEAEPEAEVTPAPTKAAPDSTGTAVTKEQCTKAAIALVIAGKAGGRAALLEVLAQYDAKSISEVAPEKYNALFAALDARTAEEKDAT